MISSFPFLSFYNFFVLNTSTRTYQVVDFVGDTFESEKTKTMKDRRDFPDNDRDCFAVQRRTQSFRTF